MKIRYNETLSQIEVAHFDKLLSAYPCAKPSPKLMRTLKDRFNGVVVQIPHDAPVDHCRDYAKGFMVSAARMIGAK